MNEAEKSGECAIGYIRRRGRRDVAFGNSYIRSHEARVRSILPILGCTIQVLYIQDYTSTLLTSRSLTILSMQQFNRH